MNVRPMSQADFTAVATLLADDERAHGGQAEIGSNELREWTSQTDLANGSWLYEDDDGLAAVGWAGVNGEVGFAIGAVHPRVKGRGIGVGLLERSESTLRANPAVKRLHQFALGADAAAAALLTGHGYRDVRRFYEMAIQLDGPPDVPDVPIESLRKEDARAFHHALDESFQDHWEHHGQPFEEWWRRHNANPNLDLGLWFLIRDGGEIAAVARNEANRNGGGYVGALGVRRAWRGRGYAKALLLHTFREFWNRGMPRITLGVDAESPTGATHLYERVGMHVETENVVFEKPA
jgi:GNAT superfamily N-acetyltransferase